MKMQDQNGFWKDGRFYALFANESGIRLHKSPACGSTPSQCVAGCTFFSKWPDEGKNSNVKRNKKYARLEKMENGEE